MWELLRFLSISNCFQLLNIHTQIIYNDAMQKVLAFGESQQHFLQEAIKLDAIARNVSMFYYTNYVHLEQLKHMFGLI